MCVLIVIEIGCPTSTFDIMENSQGKLLPAPLGTTDIPITVVVESTSIDVPSRDPCPAVQWQMNGTNINSGVDYTVSDPCSNNNNSSPYTFTLTIATLTTDTIGEYSAVFSYLATTESSELLFVTFPGEDRALQIPRVFNYTRLTSLYLFLMEVGLTHSRYTKQHQF